MNLAISLVLWLFGCFATASAEDFIDKSTQIRFPDAIVALKGQPAPEKCNLLSFALCRDRVSEHPDQRVGVAINYSFGGSLVFASVFIYGDASGLPDVPAALLDKELEQIKREMRIVESSGRYKNVVLISEDSGEAFSAIGPLKARRAHFTFEGEGRKYLSDAYISAFRGKFVKVRVSYRDGFLSATRGADAFINELGERIAEAANKPAR